MTAADRVDAIFERPSALGISLAAVVMQGGEVIAERYGTQPATPFGPGGPVDADTRLISWSTAKSITHAAVGVLVGDGVIDQDAPAAVPAWRGTDKEPITLLDLLEMRSGLRFVEDYVDGDTSHCIDMLFGSGSDDHAAYAAALPLDHEPGKHWNYSSGTTNIVCRILGDAVGGGEAGMRAFLRDRLFGPAGMESAEPRFDAAGTWVGSSYVDATARDFARFGELYRNDGMVGGERILPAGWVDHGRTLVAHDPAGGVPGGVDYGRHWWMWPGFPGSIAAHGYEGQYIVVVPERELVVVHLGKADAAVRPQLIAQLHELVRAC
ncbi:MAG: serine hydrolase domain-containing protein [Ilumatobacteraceae bacterium]